MASQQASSSKSRPNWDKDEWAAKAKEKDAKYAEQAKENDAAVQAGRKPQFRHQEELPKATEALKQRTEDLGLEKNLNKTQLVQTSTTGKGPKGAGFYCDLCDRTLKDSLSYLDHVNGRIRQTTFVSRSTLSQVRAKIASLRAQTAEKVTAKNFDFQARLAAIRENEAQEKAIRREDRKRKRQERREGEALHKVGLEKGAGKKEVEARQAEMGGMDSMMGFSGFGGGKKR